MEFPTTNVAIPILENVDVPISKNVDVPILENVDVPISQTQFQRIDLDSLDYDPRTCKQIWEYHVNQRDEIRQDYIIKGKDPNSAHRVAEQMCKDLMNQSQHLQRVVDHFTIERIANNRLQLKASIFIVPYLAFQAIAFRGNDESFSSLNRGNFFESLGIVTFWNEKVAEIIEKALKNATYTLPRIQKEILHVFSAKVKKAIREEIGDAKFCIMVDETHDESIKEQMAVVSRYVDAEGFVKERFFGLIYVVDTTALTLKKGIYSLIVNVSCKRNEQLKVANANEIARLIDLEELEIGSGLNQIGTLQRPVETRWSSHFRSVSSLLRMFTSTIEVLQNIIDDAIDGEHWAEVESANNSLTSFEFVFILHLEKETMEIIAKLCQALQSQSQDILNSMHLVSSTKALIQKFRDNGWDGLLIIVISFCEKHCIDVLDMNARYVARRGQARNQQDNVTNEHHYQVNIFYATIDSQLQELNYQFNEDAMELLRLNSALSHEALKSFRTSDLCLLVKNFYPQDFTNYDKQVLKKEIYHFKHSVVQDPEFKKLKSLFELFQWLVRIGNSEYYKLIYRMVRLVLTLLISTTTTKRAFSAMKVVKTKLRNKMENDFLTDSLMLYIEKDITSTFSLDSIVDDFEDLKEG
nr:zinc finger MYM-type protein 1-like [Quercus suber]